MAGYRVKFTYTLSASLHILKAYRLGVTDFSTGVSLAQAVYLFLHLPTCTTRSVFLDLSRKHYSLDVPLCVKHIEYCYWQFSFLFW